MTRYTSPTLRDWRLPMVRLACDRCGRQGQYRRDTLIYDLDETMPDLLHLIAQCPRRHTPGDVRRVLRGFEAYGVRFALP
jgi:hypothetical protein